MAALSRDAGRLKRPAVFALILYKERRKLSRVWPVLALVNVLALLYLYVEIRSLFRLDHAEIVWYRAVELGHIHYELMRHLPLAAGLALAAAQFLPEMRDERLRLSLHLPVDSDVIILAHLLVGSTLLAALTAIGAAGLALVCGLYFPREVVGRILSTAAPWFLAGWCGYLGAALAMLEPGLKLRLFNLLLTAALVGPLLAKVPPGAFSAAFPELLLLPPLMLAAGLLPGHHFRRRRTGA